MQIYNCCLCLRDLFLDNVNLHIVVFVYLTFVYDVNLQLLSFFMWPSFDDVNLYIVAFVYLTFFSMM